MGHKPANGPDAAPSHNPCVGQSSNPDKLDATAGSRRLALFWPRWRQLKLRPHWHHRLLWPVLRSEEHTSELQSLMRISYAVFCLKKKTTIHISARTRFINK